MGVAAERGRKRHLLRRAGPDDRITANPGLGKFGEIGANPGHRARPERLDPGAFERVEHAAGIGLHRRIGTMKPGIVMAQAERERIRSWLSLRMSIADVRRQLASLGVKTTYATLRRFAIESCGWRVRAEAGAKAA